MKKIFSFALLCVMAVFTSCKEDEVVIIAEQVSLNKTKLSLVIGTTGTLVATISPGRYGRERY